MAKFIAHTHKYTCIFGGIRWERLDAKRVINYRTFCTLPISHRHRNLDHLNNGTKLKLCRLPIEEKYCIHSQFVGSKIFECGFPHYYEISGLYIEQRRFKSKITNKRSEYDSDSDSDDDLEQIQGTKVVTFNMQSIRLDGFLKKGMAISRSKADAVFYESSIRVNGEKPSKKSQQLQIGDEVDLIRGLSPMNPDHLHVSRLELISVKEDADDDEGNLKVKVRRTKSLFIENYPGAPWKKVGVST